MRDNFETSLEAVLAHEGGYVDHPKDPGGATKYGITNKTYQRWLESINRPKKHVKYITEKEAGEILRRDYWEAVQSTSLPHGLDYAMFDAAVNSGPRQATKWLQKALGGIEVDGVFGLKTLSRAQLLTDEQVVTVIKKITDYRLGFLKGLRTWPTFGRGWTRRVNDVRAKALDMASLGNEFIKPRERKDRLSLFELFLDLLDLIFGGR